jgi:hypothetical protein
LSHGGKRRTAYESRAEFSQDQCAEEKKEHRVDLTKKKSLSGQCRVDLLAVMYGPQPVPFSKKSASAAF